MKKKTIQTIADFVIAIAVGVVTAVVAQKTYSNSEYFFNLYNNVEAADELLQQAYWYVTLSWMTISLGVAGMVFLTAIGSIILKSNSFRHNLIFISIAVLLSGVFLTMNLLIGGNIYLHGFVITANIFLSVVLILAYGILSYFDNKRLVRQETTNNTGTSV